MGSYIPGRGDKGNLDRWAKYSSDSSYHPTKADKTGNGKRSMQGSEGRMTGRDKSHNCGPRTNYPGAKDDVNNG